MYRLLLWKFSHFDGGVPKQSVTKNIQSIIDLFENFFFVYFDLLLEILKMFVCFV